ncbi:pentatricopeptide repeat-containing protein At2g37320-like [Wolffia australiana]
MKKYQISEEPACLFPAELARLDARAVARAARASGDPARAAPAHALAVVSGHGSDPLLLAMYSACGLPDRALRLLAADPPSDHLSLAAALPSAASPGHVAQIHARAARAGLLPRAAPTAPLLNALVSAYAKAGLFPLSLRLLQTALAPDVVTFTAIISAMAQAGGQDHDALRLFRRLVGLGLGLDAVAVASFLPAAQPHHARQLHAVAVRAGLEPDRRVRNALVAAYGRAGRAGAALAVFHRTPPGSRDAVSWGAAITALARAGWARPALDLFGEMVRAGEPPTPVAVSGALAACAAAAAARQGRELHQWAARRGLDTGQAFVGCALVDMYAKSGRIGDARRVFERARERNVATWNAMIGGYAFHGRGEAALAALAAAEGADGVSFVAALAACSHAGMVGEAAGVLGRMGRAGVRPRAAHYGCVVDMLGRAGEVRGAAEVVRAAAGEVGEGGWGALAWACRVGGEVRLGLESGARAARARSGAAGYYVTVANLLAEKGRWEEVETTRRVMRERGVKKEAAWSWVEVLGRVHVFVAKDREQHPEWGSLRRVLFCLTEHMEMGV